MGVGGVSSGPTIITAPVIITPQRHLHHSNHPHRDMVTLPAGTPPLYPSWTEHVGWGGYAHIQGPPGWGSEVMQSRRGGYTPSHTRAH